MNTLQQLRAVTANREFYQITKEMREHKVGTPKFQSLFRLAVEHYLGFKDMDKIRSYVDDIQLHALERTETLPKTMKNMDPEYIVIFAVERYISKILELGKYDDAKIFKFWSIYGHIHQYRER